MGTVAHALGHRYNGDAFRARDLHRVPRRGGQRQGAGAARDRAGRPDALGGAEALDAGAALVFTAPGIPMLFQGQEFLEGDWFQDTVPLDWDLGEEFHGILRLYRDLIRLRRNRAGATRGLCGRGLEILHVNEADKVIAFHRWDRGGPGDDVVVVANFANRTPRELPDRPAARRAMEAQAEQRLARLQRRLRQSRERRRRRRARRVRRLALPRRDQHRAVRRADLLAGRLSREPPQPTRRPSRLVRNHHLSVASREGGGRYWIDGRRAQEPVTRARGCRDRALADRRARALAAPLELIDRFCRQLVGLGVPLWRLRAGQRLANPLASAWGVIWTRDGSDTHEYVVPRTTLSTGAYHGSPFQHVVERRQSFRRRLLDLHPERDHQVLHEMAAGGGTDYLAVPLEYGDGSVQGLSLVSDGEAGFADRISS